MQVRKKKLLWLVMALLSSSAIWSQNLLQPEHTFKDGYVCISDSYNDLEVVVRYENESFPEDNIFTIELSDAYGNFNAPIIISNPISGENDTFKFNAKVDFPTYISGSGYKYRVKSSNPPMTSPESEAFEAHFVSDGFLILNNYQDINMCGSQGVQLEVNNAADFPSTLRYIWYRNNQVINAKSASSIEIFEPGTYKVEVDYGKCTGSLYSNEVVVNQLQANDFSIVGKNEVNICDNQSYILASDNVKDGNVYLWFKDGKLINADQPSLDKIEVTNELGSGEYHLEVDDGNCRGRSTNSVNIEFETMDLHLLVNKQQIILPDDTTKLEVSTNLSNYTVEWQRNGFPVENLNTLEVEVSEKGVYTAHVKEVNGCGRSKISEPIEVLEPEAYTLQIGYDHTFTQCKSPKAVLKIDHVKAVLGETTFIVQPEKLDAFEFRWFRLYKGLNDARYQYGNNGRTLSFEGFELGGEFIVQLILNHHVAVSNLLEVNTSPPANINNSWDILCENSEDPVELQSLVFDNSMNYQWFYNGEVIEGATDPTYLAYQPGSYSLAYSWKNCEASSDDLVIGSPDADDLVLDPEEEELTIFEGESVIVTGTRADHFKWYDEFGNLLSEESSVELSEEGVYRVEGYFGSCMVSKEVKLFVNYSLIIPNVVTPNGDGYNDTWIIPRDFRNENTEVRIFNANGIMVYHAREYQNKWPVLANLRSKSNKYFYTILQNGSIMRKGTITVLR